MLRSLARPARSPHVSIAAVACVALFAIFALGCRDVTRFSNDGDHFEGNVVAGSFVRAGIGDDARMCLTLDANHLEDAPGAITSTDGRFRDTPLRPIPQIWHDPLSTLSFGDGRSKNLIYVATPVGDGGAEADAFVVLSLMQSGSVEVRILRGAPAPSDAAAPPPVVASASASSNLFGVFTLDREKGTCSF
jgi:hypothetical protein